MSRHTKERRAKAKDKAQAQIREDNVTFDVVELLKREQLDTKPNMGKFLKQYVKMIRGLNSNSKICFYPSYQFSIAKVFVKFLDGHELIYDMNAVEGKQDKFFLYFETEEKTLTSSGVDAVQKFFDYLFRFKFVFSNDPE